MGGGGLPQGHGQGQSRQETSPITSSSAEISLAKDLEAELQQVAQETDLAGSSSSSEKRKGREDKLQLKTQTAEEES